MGNTVPPRASREATGTGRRGAGTGRSRRSENVVVTEVAPPPPATPSRRVVATAREQGRDDDGAAPAPAPAGKVRTVKIVMTRKDAEALVARLKVKAQSARERKARMAEIEGELRAGRSCGGAGGASRDARRMRPMLPPIKENRFERVTPVV